MLTEASRPANFTNEAGVDGTVRYLRNVMGLWLLQECLRGLGPRAGLRSTHLLGRGGAAAAAAVRGRPGRPGVPAAGRHARPDRRLAGRRGEAAPDARPRLVRCILDSLALAYRRAIAEAQALSGRHADVVHIVGGGARNALLCQLTADATGLPVVAGPAEATALGNVLVQARALGAAPATCRDAGADPVRPGAADLRPGGQRPRLAAGGGAPGFTTFVQNLSCWSPLFPPVLRSLHSYPPRRTSQPRLDRIAAMCTRLL